MCQAGVHGKVCWHIAKVLQLLGGLSMLYSGTWAVHRQQRGELLAAQDGN